MFDFNKSEKNNLQINTLLENEFLDFKFDVSQKTGELFENCKVSSYSGIENFCTIKNNQYITLKFSFHKYINKGLHNYNDFSINDFLNVLNDLNNKFNLNPFLAILSNLEFGVNINLPFKTQLFLDSIISYKGLEYRKETYNRKGYLLRFELNQYEVKIYDKGFQYQLKENILRFEIKVRKMDYLKLKGINVNTYSDLLNKDVIKTLKNLLLRTFKDILIYDNSINIRVVKNQKEREILLNGRNPKFWKTIENPNTYKSKRKRFKELVLKYGKENNQSIVYGLLNEKLELITEINDLTERNIDTFLNSFSCKTTPKMTDLVSAKLKHKNTQNDTSSIESLKVNFKRFCITCGNDITIQKKGSVFCSEKIFGKAVKKCRNQKTNPAHNYKKKELRLYSGVLLLFEIDELKIRNVS